MSFPIDAHLPPAFARWLAERGHTAEHARDVGLAAADDRVIWDYATAVGAVIVTKDEDFALRRAHAPTGFIVVWVHRANTTRRTLLQWFEPLLPAVVAAILRGEVLIEIA